VIENPMTGERIVFHETSWETDGEAVVFETFVQPDGFLAAHVHPKQEERFARIAAIADVPGRQDASSEQLTQVAILQAFYKPTPGLEPGTPSLRVSGHCHHRSPGVTSGHAPRRLPWSGGDSR
jgi:hypothetical protein